MNLTTVLLLLGILLAVASVAVSLAARRRR